MSVFTDIPRADVCVEHDFCPVVVVVVVVVVRVADAPANSVGFCQPTPKHTHTQRASSVKPVRLQFQPLGVGWPPG